MGNQQGKGINPLRNNTSSSYKNPEIDNAKNIKYKVVPNNATSVSNKQPTKPVKLLVISGQQDQNFYELFSDCKLLNGREIEIDQTGWNDFSLTSYSESNMVVCNLRVPQRPIPKTKQTQFRTFIPDYVLVRNVCRGIPQFGNNADRRNLLFGLMMCNLPSVNSLNSVHCMLDRPLMNREIIKLNRKYGQSQFPIIDICYYPLSEEMLITPQYPAVVKIGHGHAGFGKIKLENHKQFGDIKSIVACTDMHCTAERYIEGECDLRIQKIGKHYSVFRRESVSGNWKTNTGTSYIEFIQLLPRYKFWADVCCESFGGLDICTVDVLISKADGQEYILEFNGTASGFGDTDNDNLVLRDLVLNKMNQHFCPQLCENDDDDDEEKKIDSNKTAENEAATIMTTVNSDDGDNEVKDEVTSNKDSDDVVADDDSTQTTEMEDKDKSKGGNNQGNEEL